MRYVDIPWNIELFTLTFNMRIKDVMPLPITPEDLARREKERRRVARPGTHVDLVNLREGPAFAGPSRYEMLLSDFLVYLEAEKAEDEGYDAVMTDCTEDGPLEALRDRLRIPAIGPLEVSMHLAVMLGKRFSIIALKGNEERLFREQAITAGLSDRLLSVRQVDMNFPDLEKEGEEALNEALLRESKLAVEKDGADVLILGCTSFIGVEDLLMKEVGVPVLQPGNIAVKFAEMLYDLGLAHSKKAYPHDVERYTQLMSTFRRSVDSTP